MGGNGEIVDGPPGLCLIISNLLDYFLTSINVPLWRTYLPSSLGEASLNGCFSDNLARSHDFEQYGDIISYETFLTQNNSDHSLSSLYTYAFQTSTTSLGVLTTRDSLVVLTILVITIRHIKAILLPRFCNVGRNIGRSTHGPEWEHNNPERIMKFGEYVFRFLYHTTLSVVGVWYFWMHLGGMCQEVGPLIFGLNFQTKPLMSV